MTDEEKAAADKKAAEEKAAAEKKAVADKKAADEKKAANQTKEDEAVSGRQHLGEQAGPEKTRPFRLREGRGSHYEFGRGAVLPGEVVHLNESQARAFRDKFEPVDEKDEFKVRSAADKAKVEKSAAVEPSEESKQAQRDKATAEAKAAGIGTGGLTRIATEDHSHGTITADPAGTGQRL